MTFLCSVLLSAHCCSQSVRLPVKRRLASALNDVACEPATAPTCIQVSRWSILSKLSCFTMICEKYLLVFPLLMILSRTVPFRVYSTPKYCRLKLKTRRERHGKKRPRVASEVFSLHVTAFCSKRAGFLFCS